MDSKEFDALVADLEIRLERLRSLYEQYFMGIERIEPLVARKDVERRFQQMRRARVNNTARRFKFQNLIQRYNTLQQYWRRICREIDAGTYVRHVKRLQRQQRREAVESIPPASTVPDSDRERTSAPPKKLSEAPPSAAKRREAIKRTEVDLGAMLAQEMDADDAMRAAVEAAFDAIAEGPLHDPVARTERLARASNRPRPRRPPPAKLPPKRQKDNGAPHVQEQPDGGSEQKKRVPAQALSEEGIDGLYAKLTQARSQLKQAGQINRNSLAKSLRKTEETLRAKHKGRDVEFRVDVRDGRAVIKPVVK